MCVGVCLREGGGEREREIKYICTETLHEASENGLGCRRRNY